MKKQYRDIDFQALDIKMSDKRKAEKRRRDKAAHKQYQFTPSMKN